MAKTTNIVVVYYGGETTVTSLCTSGLLACTASASRFRECRYKYIKTD
jgi:hypothetical protein